MKVKHQALIMQTLFMSIISCENPKTNSNQDSITKVASIEVSNHKFNDNHLELLGQKYFDLWVRTQAPNATEKDVENYLDILVQDIGHQHLPYDSNDYRELGGKKSMREGMLFYLRGHTEHSATLISITTGYNVIVIKYETVSKGVHPETKQVVKSSYETIEVLEVEADKVSIIRKYSE